MKRTPLRRSAIRRWKRPDADKVPDWLFGYLLGRDKGCKAPELGATDPCFGRLTIEHVKFESRAGKRAESVPERTLILCLGHNNGWAMYAASKEAERKYLRWAQPEKAA